MRLALLALVALLAACSSGDGEAGRPAMSVSGARRLVQRAQLTETDLGAGWRLTGDQAGAQQGSDDLQRCAEAVEVTDDTLVPPRTRTFEHAADERNVQQVVSTSAVLRSPAEVDRLLRAAGTEAFARCFSQVAAGQLRDEANGVSAAPGRVTVTSTGRQVRIVAPVALRLDAQTEPLALDVLLVGRGQALWVVAGFSLGTPLPDSVVPRLGELVTARAGRS